MAAGLTSRGRGRPEPGGGCLSCVGACDLCGICEVSAVCLCPLLKPEKAQGFFVTLKDLYCYNGQKLPFAAAQIGQALCNEISSRQGLLQVHEFTLAEIEHFVDPEDKSHSKFADLADLEFLVLPRELQISGEPN
uniref:Glycine--tRNA ligase n=1 Tax=Oryza brachyantha TaxID=4533 RepID=J3N8R7_ORYBR